MFSNSSGACKTTMAVTRLVARVVEKQAEKLVEKLVEELAEEQAEELVEKLVEELAEEQAEELVEKLVEELAEEQAEELVGERMDVRYFTRIVRNHQIPLNAVSRVILFALILNTKYVFTGMDHFQLFSEPSVRKTTFYCTDCRCN